MSTPNLYTGPYDEADDAADYRTRADMAARADDAVNAATPYRAQPDTGDSDFDPTAGRARTDVENVDDAPVLNGHTPIYDQTTEQADAVDEVDLRDMPRLRSFQHELPSARFTMVARGVDIIRQLPESLFKGGAANGLKNIDLNDDDFDMSSLSIVTDLAEVLPQIEQYVIDMAHDRDHMVEWLKSRGDIGSLMGAFNLAQAHVKN